MRLKTKTHTDPTDPDQEHCFPLRKEIKLSETFIKIIFCITPKTYLIKEADVDNGTVLEVEAWTKFFVKVCILTKEKMFNT